MKSKLNKTISTTVEEGAIYLKKCIKVDSPVLLGSVLNKTILGDSLKVLKYLPKQIADLIILDPPYNLTKNYNGTIFKAMSDDDYEKYIRKVLKRCYNRLKDTGTIYICCDWKSSIIISRVLPEFFNIRNRITWGREKGRSCKDNYKNNIEDIWYCTKSDKFTFNADDIKIEKKVIAPYVDKDGKPKDWQEKDGKRIRLTGASNFWTDMVVPFWSMPENTEHPTQKPEKLIERLIKASSNENDLVLDPFVGSGTTSVVAKRLKRKYIGIEREPRYCIWAEQRLEREKL